MIFDDITDLFQHEDEMISDRAEFVKEYTEKLQAGEILLDEYEELMGDILDLNAISDASIEQDRQVMIIESINRLKTIVQTVKSLI